MLRVITLATLFVSSAALSREFMPRKLSKTWDDV